MIKKIRELCQKYREILMYLIFGVLTTLVSWIIYYGMLFGGRAIFGIPAEDVTSAGYLTLYTVSQTVSWILSVLFAFFTNRKWVFTQADRSVPVLRQLGAFAGSRLVTFGLDFVITYGGTLLLGTLFPSFVAMAFLGKNRNMAELLSKAVAAVVVVICNYIISKLLVFRSRGKQEQNK